MLDAAIAESSDVPVADAIYDEAQTAVAAQRPAADALIKRARAELAFSTYEMDAPSQRRVMRNHGAIYRYMAGETVDEGDEAAVVDEGVA